MFSKDFRQKYFKEVGIDETSKKETREAYETAHRIREVEIELYWKRTTYIWAMQAALIGIVMFLQTGGKTTITVGFFKLTSSTAPTSSSPAAILFVSTLALIIACLWSLLIKGAKFWQDIWERHVDLLGESLGQNLYQVYPIHKLEDAPPYSVSKINNYVVNAFILFWFFNLIWALWDLSDICANFTGIQFIPVFFGWIILYGGVSFFFCVQFKHCKAYDGLRMSNLGKRIEGLPSGANEPVLYSRKVQDS